MNERGSFTLGRLHAQRQYNSRRHENDIVGDAIDPSVPQVHPVASFDIGRDTFYPNASRGRVSRRVVTPRHNVRYYTYRDANRRHGAGHLSRIRETFRTPDGDAVRVLKNDKENSGPLLDELRRLSVTRRARRRRDEQVAEMQSQREQRRADFEERLNQLERADAAREPDDFEEGLLFSSDPDADINRSNSKRQRTDHLGRGIVDYD